MTDRYTPRIYLALAEGRDLSSDEETHLAGCAACGAAAERALDFERALHRDLADRAVPVPADPRGLPTDRRGRMAPALLAVVAAIAVIGVGGSVALIAMPEPSPSPTPPVVAVTAEPSGSPSAPVSASPSATLPVPTPSSEPSPTPDPIVAGTYAQVADGERTELRDGPDGMAFAQLLPAYDVWVVGREDGWVHVEAIDSATLEYVFGWVRVEGLVPMDAIECDAAGGVWGIVSSHPQRQLECLGGEPVVVEGYATGGDAIQRAYGGDPSWLAEIQSIALSSVIGPAVEGFSLPIHLPPDLDEDVPLSDRDGHQGTRLRVTGHLDDRASSGCERRPVAGSYPPMDAELSVQWCRQRFVVDSVEVVPEG